MILVLAVNAVVSVAVFVAAWLTCLKLSDVTPVDNL